MSTTIFTRVAAPKVREAHDLVISLHLVHLMRNDRTRQKLMSNLTENQDDFLHFVDLLVPYGSRYLEELSLLANAAVGNSELTGILRSTYERHIGIIYRDCVRTVETGINGNRKVTVASEDCWISFLAKCSRIPEMSFVLDAARQMTSPFGNCHYTPPPLPDFSATATAIPAPIPVGMH